MNLTSIACCAVAVALFTSCSGAKDPPGTVQVSQFMRARGETPETARPVREAVLTGGECGVGQTQSSGGQRISATFPNRRQPDTSIMLELDSGGNLIRYSETRGIPQPSPTVEEMQQQMATMTRTQIQLDFTTGQALMLNFEPGLQPRSATGPNGDFQRPHILPDFEERVASVRRLCSI